MALSKKTIEALVRSLAEPQENKRPVLVTYLEQDGKEHSEELMVAEYVERRIIAMDHIDDELENCSN